MTRKKSTDRTRPGGRHGGAGQQGEGAADVPYTMKLPDGRTVYVEVPAEHVDRDRSGELVFKPAGVRFLDRVRALALPADSPPRSAYIAALRSALGMTQAEFGEAVAVDKMTVWRRERSAIRPSPAAVARIQELAKRVKRRGVALST